MLKFVVHCGVVSLWFCEVGCTYVSMMRCDHCDELMVPTGAVSLCFREVWYKLMVPRGVVSFWFCEGWRAWDSMRCGEHVVP